MRQHRRPLTHACGLGAEKWATAVQPAWRFVLWRELAVGALPWRRRSSTCALVGGPGPRESASAHWMPNARHPEGGRATPVHVGPRVLQLRLSVALAAAAMERDRKRTRELELLGQEILLGFVLHAPDVVIGYHHESQTVCLRRFGAGLPLLRRIALPAPLRHRCRAMLLENLRIRIVQSVASRSLALFMLLDKDPLDEHRYTGYDSCVLDLDATALAARYMPCVFLPDLPVDTALRDPAVVRICRCPVNDLLSPRQLRPIAAEAPNVLSLPESWCTIIAVRMEFGVDCAVVVPNIDAEAMIAMQESIEAGAAGRMSGAGASPNVADCSVVSFAETVCAADEDGEGGDEDDEDDDNSASVTGDDRTLRVLERFAVDFEDLAWAVLRQMHWNDSPLSDFNVTRFDIVWEGDWPALAIGFCLLFRNGTARDVTTLVHICIGRDLRPRPGRCRIWCHGSDEHRVPLSLIADDMHYHHLALTQLYSSAPVLTSPIAPFALRQVE